MKWLDCADRMDQKIIKKDGTAVDNEYFMATHVPFRDLEFIEFGDTESDPIHLNEEQIYEQYIVNRANKHQMIIVRGTNGTGKSHLICWLNNRFVNDKENYFPDKEKVIFLRRLGNTVRGAVQQMLDEGLVQDKELQDKFSAFCNAAESQSEEEFKTSIYTEYAKRVLTDTSGKPFKSIICKNIAAFLYDSRVQDYLMRPEGPIDRCYQLITAGAKTMVTDETEIIFTNDDFVFPKDVAKDIKKNAAEEVKSFYLYDLRDDTSMITRLVSYLNHFTSAVMQSCANITSENARDLFVNLRKSLYKEGKGLTIFIEDFTSFSIVESELITALAVENGGEYSDLCRVTSVIGITDGYYDSFRDNFKDRVTKQIKVTEHSYGGDEFLLEMAARYLNAIYCTDDVIQDWYRNNQLSDTMPISGFKPEFKWDSIVIGSNEFTLYPFNRKSLLTLYDKLKNKSPRYYLTYVIQHFFAQFADGMEYGDDWRFPEIPSYISSVALQPPYADQVENTAFSDIDKQRLKVIFTVWGDGTTEANETTVGAIEKGFLNSIGLGSFGGVSSGTASTASSNSAGTDKKPKNDETEVKKPKQTPEEIAFSRKKADIEAWFEDKKTLEYASDYNKWVGNFVVQGIAWQDEGLPGYFVTQRLRNGSFVSIEDSKLDTNKNKAIVLLERSSEARTVLMGLTLFDFYKHWDFENAEYYQFVLINWLEKNKALFIKNLFGDMVGMQEHPIITWCIAAEYLQRGLYGDTLDYVEKDDLLSHLIRDKQETSTVIKKNKDWNDVLTYLKNQEAVRKTIKTYLELGSNTIMGIVGEQSSSKVKFYRTSELYKSLEHLSESNWDISNELAVTANGLFEKVRTHLQALYSKVNDIVISEKKLAKETIDRFEELIGKNPTKQMYMEVISEIQNFFVTCGTAHEFFDSALKMKFDESPSDQANIVMNLYNTLKESLTNDNMIEVLKIYAGCPIEQLEAIISSLDAVEKLAKTLHEKRSKMIGEIEQIDPMILEGALTKLEELSDKIEQLEVIE